MTSSEDYVTYVMDQARGPWTLRQRKMFGDYMVYVNDKAILLLCDDQTFVNIVPQLDGLMADAECAVPYPGAKKHYILDVDDSERVRRVLSVLEPITALPKSRKRKTDASAVGRPATGGRHERRKHMKNIAILVFDGFEPLDVFGPTEVFGCIGRIRDADDAPDIRYYSITGGTVHGAIGTELVTKPLDDVPDGDILLIPGGPGTRILVKDGAFLEALRQELPRFSQVLTVCTGSALLAATGTIDGRRATSNKRAFAWVTSVRPEVDWVAHARWVEDGNLTSSSGVSAGTDMALSVVAKSYGTEFAKTLAAAIEYVWNDDPGNDPFAVR